MWRVTVRHMSNQSSLSSVALKLIGIAVVAFVAIFLVTAVIGAIAGIIKLFITLGMIVLAVIFAGKILRRL
ncbi:hypothetical protein C8N24_5772 [Solirubrobacter pauli]|uniref:Uncharacterized protein n=2 Tax=Solirubrobacter pauli TaxID=166793 RepID=A0A660L718_9ACTN|nr:hypothetical protein C8N24_5772 [Solirubrobacter pauli]